MRETSTRRMSEGDAAKAGLATFGAEDEPPWPRSDSPIRLDSSDSRVPLISTREYPMRGRRCAGPDADDRGAGDVGGDRARAAVVAGELEVGQGRRAVAGREAVEPDERVGFGPLPGAVGGTEQGGLVDLAPEVAQDRARPGTAMAVDEGLVEQPARLGLARRAACAEDRQQRHVWAIRIVPP